MRSPLESGTAEKGRSQSLRPSARANLGHIRNTYRFEKKYASKPY